LNESTVKKPLRMYLRDSWSDWAENPVFDVIKLEWLSQHYLKTMDGRRLAELAEPFVRAAGLTPPADLPRFVGMLDTLRERAKTLVEMVEQGRFYFEAPSAYDAKAAPKLLTAEGARRLGLVIERLEGLPEFTAPAIERAVRALTEELGLKLVDVAQLARLAVTGRTASPPIFDVLALLGSAETRARLRRAREFAERSA
jgi:glutamyl-tRNA synthetase